MQKHAASRLHYDLRLEHEGVLLSWAVPKGPSLDPADRTLAVQVEDHPLDYGTFEGVIPEGEYGGGTVMLWDRGTWEPLGDVAEGLTAGSLKFRLHGQRLRGQWALVRMKPRGGRSRSSSAKPEWLLIKDRDEHMQRGDGRSSLEDQQRSIRTGRTMDQIASAGDASWSTAVPESLRLEALAALDGTAPASERSVVEPMLATAVDAPPAGEDWLHEIKFDGYRMLIHLDRGKARLISRSGKDWTERFASVAEAAAALPVNDAVIDGELVVLMPDGTTSFQKLQNVARRGGAEPLVFYSFDLPQCSGRDLSRVPLLERKRLLRELVPADASGTLRFSDHVVGQGSAFSEQACRFNLEGIVSKRADGRYLPGRSRLWLKTKCVQREELLVLGYTPPKGSRRGFGALLLGYGDPSGSLHYAGRCGTGFDEATLKDLHEQMEALRVAEPVALAKPPPGRETRDAVWVRPGLVVEVAFTEWTDEGLLRHASFQGLREDKLPGEVVLEPKGGYAVEVQDSQEVVAAVDKPPVHDVPSGDRYAGVRLSNPDRVLYPDQGLTKRDLAAYWAAVADWALPHIAGRPLSLVRCPRGRAGKCFYQKHPGDGMSEAIQQVEVPEGEESAVGLAVRDVAGLVTLAQMGVLEVHPWGARLDRLDRPDRLVFDLDPGPGVAWSAVIEAAHELRDRLAEMDLLSFCKTSGGKGLHIVVPIDRRSDWATAKEFTGGVVRQLVKEHPRRYVAVMTKSKRHGKIYIDYHRNGQGATAVAAYSPRARQDAPVSVPVTWDEVTPDLAADGWTVQTLPDRLKGLAGDPWDGMSQVRQSLTKDRLAAAGVGD